MTRGPLPPHERAWRHPSELPAPQHEPTSRVGRVLIASTAAVSLLLVAWLAISMTPQRSGDADPVGDVAAGSGFPAGGSPAGDPQFSSDDSMVRAVSSLLARNENPPTNPWSSEAVTTTSARELATPTTGASATSSPAPVAAPVPSDSTESLVTVSAASLEVEETSSTDVIGQQTDDPAGTNPVDTITASTPLALANTSEPSQFAGTAPESFVPADPSEVSTTTSSSTTSSTSSTSTTSTTSTTTTTDPLPSSAKQLNG